MKQVPDSLLAFQHMFPDDDALRRLADRNALAGRLRLSRVRP